MDMPTDLLNRAGEKADRQNLNWVQGVASTQIVHWHLLFLGVRDMVVGGLRQTVAGRTVDTDITVGGFVVDVKSTRCGCYSVPRDQFRLPCRAYALVSLDGRGSWEFDGWLYKSEFWEYGIRRLRGEPLGDTGLTANYDLCYLPVRSSYLRPMEDLAGIMRDIAAYPGKTN